MKCQFGNMEQISLENIEDFVNPRNLETLTPRNRGNKKLRNQETNKQTPETKKPNN